MDGWIGRLGADRTVEGVRRLPEKGHAVSGWMEMEWWIGERPSEPSRADERRLINRPRLCSAVSTRSRRPPRRSGNYKRVQTIGSPNYSLSSERASSSRFEREAAEMGISGMPEPADGLVWFLLYNTVASVAAVAGLLRAALVSLDLQHAAPSWLLDGEDEAATAEAAGPGLAERFRRSFRPLRFGPAAAAADCRVCLAGFEPEAVVNRLPCGHLFHRRCVETWLLYDRATCPLCRARVLPAAAAVEAAPRLVEPE